MTRFTRLTILSAMTLGLAACGGGAKLGGGKEGAAQAAFQASQPAGRGSKTGQALLEQALASGAVNVSLTANCAEGGTASLALVHKLDGLLNYSITYDACSEDGENAYTGTMETSVGFDLDLNNTSASGSFFIAMKGKLTIEGEVSDFIDANVKMSMAFAATSMRSGSVSLVVDGTIKTGDGSYVYAKESLAVASGRLPKA